MTVRPRSIQRFFNIRLSALLLLAITACAKRAPVQPAEPDRYATRLVLALDGINYSDIVEARKRGRFAGFHAPSKLISTFPSISDIAWHEILGVLPPRGYQRMYYSNAMEVVVGETMDALKPIEFEERMDMAFESLSHHLGAYLISDPAARREIDSDVHDFFQMRGRQTVYIYNVGPDAMQHTNGDLEAYLQHLDLQLTALQREYHRRTNRDLEIVVISDHGHNKSPGAKFVPIEKTLRASGFRIARELRSPNDVAFSVDGVTTGFGVFCARDSVSSVASALANMEGVEIVSAKLTDSSFAVMRGPSRARIDVRHTTAGDRFRYTSVNGDPLQMAFALETMRAERAIDADGFADLETWKRFTMNAEFPVAVPRIVRGHTVVTLNPAPILVSLLVTHRIGIGLSAVSDRILSLGGTHGSLSTPSSIGVLMTNFRDTFDDVTTTVRSQLDGFRDLGAVRYKKSGARLSDERLIASDERSPFRDLADGSLIRVSNAPKIIDFAAAPGMSSATGVEVWITPEQLAWSRDSGLLKVEVRLVSQEKTVQAAITSTSVLIGNNDDATGENVSGGPQATNNTPTRAVVTSDRLRYFLPLTQLQLPTLAPRTLYEVRVTLHRKPDSVSRNDRRGSQKVAVFKTYTDSVGKMAAY